MTEEYLIEGIGRKPVVVRAECFLDAGWKVSCDPPFAVTRIRTGERLHVIGQCKECRVEVWLDEDWVVADGRKGTFCRHRDCNSTDGIAWNESQYVMSEPDEDDSGYDEWLASGQPIEPPYPDVPF